MQNNNSYVDKILQNLPKEHRDRFLVLQNAGTFLPSNSGPQTGRAAEIDNNMEKYIKLISENKDSAAVEEKLVAEISEVIRVKREQIKLIDKLEEEIHGLLQNIQFKQRLLAIHNRKPYVENDPSLNEEKDEDDKMEDDSEEECEPPSKRTKQ